MQTGHGMVSPWFASQFIFAFCESYLLAGNLGLPAADIQRIQPVSLMCSAPSPYPLASLGCKPRAYQRSALIHSGFVYSHITAVERRLPDE